MDGPTRPEVPCPAVPCPQGIALCSPTKGVAQPEKGEGHTPGDPSTTLGPELSGCLMGCTREAAKATCRLRSSLLWPCVWATLPAPWKQQGPETQGGWSLGQQPPLRSAHIRA